MGLWIFLFKNKPWGIRFDKSLSLVCSLPLLFPQFKEMQSSSVKTGPIAKKNHSISQFWSRFFLTVRENMWKAYTNLQHISIECESSNAVNTWGLWYDIKCPRLSGSHILHRNTLMHGFLISNFLLPAF